METKNEDENQLVINDINSANSGQGLKTVKTSSFPWKKLFIFGGLILIAIIAIIILIIILTRKSSDNKDDTSPDKQEDKLDIGRIICVYSDDSGEVQILGEDFIKNSDFDIYISGVKMKYSKVYDLMNYGTNIVEIRLYSDLNMDNMFKDVPSLISIEMISLNETKILSMISTFENCRNLEFFSITGFSANELKSMKKLFYNSAINEYYFINFTTNNLEDISYMFASTYISSFKFENITTENVIDMSYLFTNCSSLIDLDISNIISSKTENMSHMFEGLNQIRELDLSHFETRAVKDMSYMFKNCFFVNKIELSNFNTELVEDMSYMFDECNLLTSLYLNIVIN